MDCPNCGKPNEEGAGFCANCGSPLPSSTPPPQQLFPPAAPSQVVQPGYPMPAPQPKTSGMAKASMWLGIASIAGIIISIVVLVIVTASMIGQIGSSDLPAFQDPEELQQWLQSDPDLQSTLGVIGVVGIGSMGCSLLSMLSALLAVIFGVVGLSQEGSQPTQSGRTQSIVGTILGALPLLCCVVYFILVFAQR